MSVQLIKPVDETTYVAPQDKDVFFSKKDQETLEGFEARETRAIGQPGKSCDVNLFLGLFFDGTGNNYDASTNAKDRTHSNVARLYGAYPGQSVPGVPATPDGEWTHEPANYDNFFKIYIPGVGTPFQKVDDSGEGRERTAGRAAALYGERRIIWALLQTLNAVFRYCTRSGKGPGLFSAAEALNFCKNFYLGWANSEIVDPGEFSYNGEGDISPTRAQRNNELLTEMLNKLHAAIRAHMIDPATGQCSVVDPGRVQNVYVSVFGFSRGAAEARVFVNWFRKLCELDAKLSGHTDRTLGSFPVTFDFLGLFDTVASVGVAASALLTDGHGAWADSENSLRIPDDIPCLQIVAAHEFRRSFPLDSAHRKTTLPAKTLEWVCPGMHSDIGGGYLPREQGKGTDATGADMLSRIVLAVMYRAARLAGAPLKLEFASEAVKEQFRIAPQVIKEFNAYLGACERKEGPLRDVMDEQRRLYILWRKSWAGRIAEAAFTKRATAEDRADLISADEGFVQEVSDFETYRQGKRTPPVYGINEFTGEAVKGPPTVPGSDWERRGEWERIDAYWDQPTPVEAVCTLLNERVHDSHAWFKLTGYEAADFKKEMGNLAARKQVADEYKDHPEFRVPGLTPTQEEWLKLYQETGEFAPAFTEGREFYSLGAGYLRYRRVYAGADNIRLTRNDRGIDGNTGTDVASVPNSDQPAEV